MREECRIPSSGDDGASSGSERRRQVKEGTPEDDERELKDGSIIDAGGE